MHNISKIPQKGLKNGGKWYIIYDTAYVAFDRLRVFTGNIIFYAYVTLVRFRIFRCQYA